MPRIPALLLFLAISGAAAQETAQTQVPATVGVYLDCESSGCDFDYFRTELTMVNWVRDRQVADVHVLVTAQSTGAGGQEYTVTFIGLGRFQGISDTLRHVSEPDATQDQRRQGLARTFRLGLVRYIARTPDAARLSISIATATGTAEQASARRDPWKSWVFRTSLNGNFNGEKTYLNYGLYGNLDADRITAGWKTRINAYQSYNQSEFEIDPAQPRFVNIQRRYGGSLLQVKSLGEHWSSGARVNVASSTYDNYRRVIRAYPAVEYNLFPYSQSTRRQLRLEYNLGWADFTYNDTTINDHLREGMPLQRLLVSGAAREQWGSLNLSSLATSYLDDRSRYRLSTFAEISLRLFRGFSLEVFGEYAMIRDQFNLAKKNFSPEEILTRQFQRGTGYRYWSYVGISYRFGSIYNNVVNPRMTGSFFD